MALKETQKIINLELLTKYDNKMKNTYIKNIKEGLEHQITTAQTTVQGNLNNAVGSLEDQIDDAVSGLETKLSQHNDTIRQYIANVVNAKTTSYVIDDISDIKIKDGDELVDYPYEAGKTLYEGVAAIVVNGVTIYAGSLRISDNILIRALNVPDFWVSAISETGETGGTVSLSPLETQKSNLSEGPSTSDVASLIEDAVKPVRNTANSNSNAINGINTTITNMQTGITGINSKLGEIPEGNTVMGYIVDHRSRIGTLEAITVATESDINGLFS